MVHPRSARAHGEVLKAALRLFAERGIDATSMDAIAEESGVSKATIYKHWLDKDALCLEALAQLHGGDQPGPACDSGDVRADLIAVLSYEPPPECAELRMRIMPHLMAYAARNRSFAELWRERVFEPPRAQLTRILKRSIARGQLPKDLDLGLSIALLLGPFMYFHVFKRLHGGSPEHLAERIVGAFWRAHALDAQAANRRPARARKPRRSV